MSRLLGSSEINVWFNNHLAKMNFVMVAELEGAALADEAFLAACRAVIARHPMLRTTIQRWPLRYVQDTGQPEITIVDSPVRDRIQYLNNTAFDESRALARFELVRDGNQQFLLFAPHHCISDGIGGRIVLQDLMQALNGEVLASVDELPPATEDNRSPYARGLRGLLFFFRALAYMARNIARFGFAAPTMKLNGDKSGPLTSNYHSLAFDADVSERIVNKARQIGSTVHGLLTACICEAIGPELLDKDGAYQFGSPADLRGRLPDSSYDYTREVLFANSMVMACVRPDEQSLAEMAQMATEQNRTMLARGFGQVFISIPSMVYRLWRDDSRGLRKVRAFSEMILKNATNGMTNIGRMDVADANPNATYKASRAYFVVNPGIMAPMAHTAASNAGLITVNLCFTEPTLVPQRMTVYAERLQKTILEFVALPPAGQL